MLEFYYNLFGSLEGRDPMYSSNVFPILSWCTLFTPFILAAIYYLLINRSTAGYNLMRHWLILVVVSFIFGLGYVLLITSSVITEGANFGYNITLGIANGFLSALLLLIASLIFKKFSVYATQTPF